MVLFQRFTVNSTVYYTTYEPCKNSTATERRKLKLTARSQNIVTTLLVYIDKLLVVLYELRRVYRKTNRVG